MNIALRSAPRIVVDVLADVGGEEFDLVELNSLLEALELGDTSNDDDGMVAKLAQLGVVESYVRDGRRMVTVGREFDRFVAELQRAIALSDLELPLSRD
jgi:hypothetical protein